MIGEDEFGNYASSTLVEQLKLTDSGNLEMQDNKAFEEGSCLSIYH